MRMKTANEYRALSADCRRIAQLMKGKDKETLLQMAELWEKQAQEAERNKT